MARGPHRAAAVTVKAYAPHVAFVAPARASSALIQTVVGFIAVEFLYGVGRQTLDFFLINLAPEAAANVIDRVSPGAILWDLFAFGLMIAVLALVVWKTHDRGLGSLIGNARVARRDFLRAFIGAAVLFLTLELALPWWGSDTPTMQSLHYWLLLLPWSLLALLVQTSAEELFYRGYLQQQLAARFRQTWVWLIVPNVAFASVHWFNEAAFEDSTRYVIWAFMFGVAASDLVARSGSLGAAIGFHLANNAFAFLVVGERGAPDSGLALFLIPPFAEPPDAALLPAEPILNIGLGVDIGILVLAWLAVRVAIRR